MAKLSEKTIYELNNKINFNEAFRAVNYLREARAYLSDELIENMQILIKKLDSVTDWYNSETDDGLFDLADEIDSEIMEAQEHLEKIADVLEDIMGCWSDTDEGNENDEECIGGF